MTFKEQEQLLNKPYWNKKDLMQFFNVKDNLGTKLRKQVIEYMHENNIRSADTIQLPYRAIKEALDIDEFYIRNQARKDRKENI